MYIGFHWEDSRITKLPPSSKDEKTFLDLQFSKVLWTPHIDVYNLREMISFNALKKDLAGDEVYLPYQYISIYRLLKWISSLVHLIWFTIIFIVGLVISNGSKVYYSQATIITIFCAMRFDQYPLDTQVKLASNIRSVSKRLFDKKMSNKYSFIGM